MRSSVSSSHPGLLRCCDWPWLLAPDQASADDLLQTALLRTYLRWRRIEHDPGAYARRVLVTVAAAHHTNWRRMPDP